MNNWVEWRKNQRTELMARREAVAAADHLRWSVAISATLEQGFPALQTGVVGFCWPHRGEYDPRPAMDFFRKHGATLALPEVVSEVINEVANEAGNEGRDNGAPLRFRKWWPQAPMKTGAYAIPVPDNTELVTPNALIMPMLGFDQRGYRLGYGGGYFDRTLATIKPRPLAIGVGFEVLRLDSIHPQPHDIVMDFVVTEAGIYQVTASGLTLTDC